MAYRFLVEVPESLSEAAELLLGRAEDTQIVVNRPSYAMGYDQPYSGLTIASHNLRVVDRIYDWYEAQTPPRPDIKIVLNTGQRVSLADFDRAAMISAIRRDQPWVERTIPHIGEHAEDEFVTETQSAGSLMAAEEALNAVRDVAAVSRREMNVHHLNYVAIRVTDLRRAEEFYTRFFEMEIIGRTRSVREGEYRILSPDYSWDEAIVSETQADDTYLRNGPLTIALKGMGLGARLDRTLLDRISIEVDAHTFTRLKGKAMMSSYEMHGESGTSFAFRDPFGVVWELTLPGFIVDVLRQTFEARV